MNKLRGEVALQMESDTFTLCLTLGALAEIESHFGAGNLSELDGCLSKPNTADLIAILGALMRGGGHEVSNQDVANFSVNFAQSVKAIAEAFQAAGFSEPHST